MKAGIISQVRMTSTRLPAKVLLPAASAPLLDHHVRRLGWAGLPIVIATTTNATDDSIAEFSLKRNLLCYRGSEDNVLDRFYQAAVTHGLDTIIRVTSDCPLIDGHVIARAFAAYTAADDRNLYLCNTQKRTFPRGFDFEIFSFEMLEQAWKHATQDYEREHVTPFIWKTHPERFGIQHWTRREDDSNYRLTVDEPDDYRLVKKLFEEFGVANESAEAIIEIMRSHPELSRINEHVEQKKV